MNSPLETEIKARIQENGPIGFDIYMSLCLSHPKYGYYMTRDPFGKSGDFTTAPEISQLFGEIVGIYFASQWIEMGKPEPIEFIEFGGGRGTFIKDFLNGTKHIDGFHKSLSLTFVETSPVLTGKQKEALSDIGISKNWCIDFKKFKTTTPVFIFGNEFLDALPVKQFVKDNNNWHERLVGLNDDIELSFGLSPMPANNAFFPAGLSNGAVVEKSDARRDILKDICRVLKANGGQALFVDYGYLHGNGDTFQAVKDHDYVSPFHRPGEVDLTTHVDFQDLMGIAEKEKIEVMFCKTQRDFLKAYGIEERAAQLKKQATDNQKQDIEIALKRLLDKDQMGTLFKVLAIGS